MHHSCVIRHMLQMCYHCHWWYSSMRNCNSCGALNVLKAFAPAMRKNGSMFITNGGAGIVSIYPLFSETGIVSRTLQSLINHLSCHTRDKNGALISSVAIAGAVKDDALPSSMIRSWPRVAGRAWLCWAYCSPFFNIGKSEDTTGPVTGVVLQSIQKFLEHPWLSMSLTMMCVFSMSSIHHYSHFHSQYLLLLLLLSVLNIIV